MLNCMATYRNTDKKLCDNILAPTAFTELTNSITYPTLGDDFISKATNSIDLTISNLNKSSDILENIGFRGGFGISAIDETERAALGKYAPLSGNWHRSPG